MKCKRFCVVGEDKKGVPYLLVKVGLFSFTVTELSVYKTMSRREKRRRRFSFHKCLTLIDTYREKFSFDDRYKNWDIICAKYL